MIVTFLLLTNFVAMVTMWIILISLTVGNRGIEAIVEGPLHNAADGLMAQADPPHGVLQIVHGVVENVNTISLTLISAL